MDKDGNGQVDWEEFQAAVPGMKRPAFDTIDADKSGGICRSEWDNFMKSHMGGQKGMPPAGMGMPAGMGGKAMPPAGAEKGGMPMIQPPCSRAKPPASYPLKTSSQTEPRGFINASRPLKAAAKGLFMNMDASSTETASSTPENSVGLDFLHVRINQDNALRALRQESPHPVPS